MGECPLAVNTGSVCSCMIGGCSPSRGPTECHWGTCYCQDGYCRYPASTLHVRSRYCVARLPGETCHVSRFCYSGGLTRSFCEKGLCMCKWGYKVESLDDGKFNCVSDASTLATAVAHNATQEEIQLLIEQKEDADMASAQNLAVACAWLCGSLAFLALAVVFALRRHTNKEALQPTSYSLLVA